MDPNLAGAGNAVAASPIAPRPGADGAARQSLPAQDTTQPLEFTYWAAMSPLEPANWRRAVLRTLPVALRGRAVMKTTRRGSL